MSAQEALTDTPEDDGLAANGRKTAAEAQAQHPKLLAPTPVVHSPLHSSTPDSENCGPLSTINGLAAPLNDINNDTPDSNSAGRPAESVGTPDLMQDPSFPMAKFRPLPNASAAAGLNVPPPSSAPMSRNASANGLQPSAKPVAIPTSPAAAPGTPEPTTRTQRSHSTSSKSGEKKGFLAKMFHHEPKMERLSTNTRGAGGESPPLTPTVSDSDASRLPSRAPSMKRNKDNKDADDLPVERRPSLLGQRRLSERTLSGSGATPSGSQPVEASSTKFTLKDLISGGKSHDGKLSRRPSDRGSARGSDRGSTKGSDAGDNASTASLLKKYGVCDRATIGKGATAVVRLAHKWDRREEKLYAVKEFRKRRKNETEKEYVKKLTSEFCISSTLHHINIVETVDLVQDEQQHWCEVMEYCPGGDLYAAIKKGGMSSGEVECTFKQLLQGIQYLHSMGVAHRDIKPENLLLDGRGHVKITDFGVSDVFRMCWEKKTHFSKGLCGSEPYIAPELFDQKEYDARLVDVWAAAIVFYCMQFQELPWRVAKPTDPTFATYLSQYYPSGARPEGAPACPAPLNNLIPRECRHVIKHMLDPDPKTRWTVDDALKDKWVQSVEVCVEGRENGHTHTTVAPETVRIS